MTDQFVGANKMMPITPPPEMVRQWCHEDGDEIKTSPRWYQIVCAKAACWGADQELEACCEWLEDADLDDSQKVSWVNLRAARRPKPPSVKEQALKALTTINSNFNVYRPDIAIIRRALEQLDG